MSISINLGSIEHYDSVENVFNKKDIGVVEFEYTLKAVYEWECKWKKPFLKGDLTPEETIDIFLRMAKTKIQPEYLNLEAIKTLSDYIRDPQTATTFNITSGGSKGPGKFQTSEEIYALMILNNVPIEFENRNLNRLMTILRIIGLKSEPPKKMTKEEVLRQNSELNRLRKEQMKSRG